MYLLNQYTANTTRTAVITMITNANMPPMMGTCSDNTATSREWAKYLVGASDKMV